MQATRLRKGMLIKVGENLFRVLELQHVTPGNLRGFVRVSSATCGRARSATTAPLGGQGGAGHPGRDADGVPLPGRRHVPLHEQRDLRADRAVRRGAGRRRELPGPEHQADDRVLRGAPGRHRPAADRRAEGHRDRARHQGRLRLERGKPAKMETGLVVQVPAVHQRGRRDPHRHRDRAPITHRAGQRSRRRGDLAPHGAGLAFRAGRPAASRSSPAACSAARARS